MNKKNNYQIFYIWKLYEMILYIEKLEVWCKFFKSFVSCKFASVLEYTVYKKKIRVYDVVQVEFKNHT